LSMPSAPSLTVALLHPADASGEVSSTSGRDSGAGGGGHNSGGESSS
jgi:hypothetical protein